MVGKQAKICTGHSRGNEHVINMGFSVVKTLVEQVRALKHFFKIK